MQPWGGDTVAKDDRFSRDGAPATDFERQLLARCRELEDPWREIADAVGLDAVLRIMDLFHSCHLTVPRRASFVARLHRVWLDAETLRMRRARVPDHEIAAKLEIKPRSIRRRLSRVLKRGPQKRA